MAKYITRVQLHEAKKADIEMARASFTRTNQAAGGGAINPSAAAEYNFQGNASLLDINAVVSRVAKKTGKKYSYTVIKERRVPVL